jgi:hypothetical protein
MYHTMPAGRRDREIEQRSLFQIAGNGGFHLDVPKGLGTWAELVLAQMMHGDIKARVRHIYSSSQACCQMRTEGGQMALDLEVIKSLSDHHLTNETSG